MTQLVCINGCRARHSALSGLVECPTCAGLLDPVRQPEAKGRSAARWRALLDQRAASVKQVDRSGVWAFREWVLPELRSADIVTLGEGRAPLLDVQLGGARVLVKQCGQQPTGSFKDLGMTVLVSAAKAMRRKRPVRALLCASTGDTSAALAAYGARAGIPVVVLLPRGKVSPAQLMQPRANGAVVLELDGDFDACMRVIQQLAREPGYLLANSKNPLRLLGQSTVAFEIARELGYRAPHFVVVPSGNLGNVSAIADGFALLQKLGLCKGMPRLVAAQVAAADPLFRAARTGFEILTPMTARDTMASAIRIGDPVSWPRARAAMKRTRGLATSCSEAEIVAAMALLDRQGLLSCPHTGAAVAGVQQLQKQGVIGPRHRVVVVSTASGLKFADVKDRVAPLALQARARVEDVRAALREVGA